MLSLFLDLRFFCVKFITLTDEQVSVFLHDNILSCKKTSDGEGCFFINIQKNNSTTNRGMTEKIWLTFQRTQHFRDALFMESIIKYLDCGRVKLRSTTPTVDFLVNRYTDIHTKVLSFLEKYPLQSVKQKDFHAFCEAANLIGNKEHFSVQGIEKIKMMKRGMNKKR